jgi:hypothetical protein
LNGFFAPNSVPDTFGSAEQRLLCDVVEDPEQEARSGSRSAPTSEMRSAQARAIEQAIQRRSNRRWRA